MSWEEPPRKTLIFESLSGDDSSFERYQIRALGTENIFLLDRGSVANLDRVVQDAFFRLEGLEERLSKFLPDSEVSELNAYGVGTPVPVGDDLFFLLTRAREAWQVTEGAFDPTVGKLMDAWGLVDMEGRVPAAEEVAALLANCGMDHVVLDAERQTAMFDREGLGIDLGGIGKGYAVDQIAAHFQAAGVSAGAILSGRSTAITWGSPPGGEAAWPFAVVDPEEKDDFLLNLVAAPGAISSSGAYERMFRRDGRMFGHILDPRTGEPCSPFKAVTLWTETALLGDVLSTALSVLGEQALAPGGAVEALAKRWSSGDPARVSALAIAADPGSWGGMRVVERHWGEPALVRVPG